MPCFLYVSFYICHSFWVLHFSVCLPFWMLHRMSVCMQHMAGEQRKPLCVHCKTIKTMEVVPMGEPTDWCSRMVVCPKNDGSPRRTVDLQALNRTAVRQTHPMDVHQICDGLLEWLPQRPTRPRRQTPYYFY